MRNLGMIGFVATFILDVGKGIVAVLLASHLTSRKSPLDSPLVRRGNSATVSPSG